MKLKLLAIALLTALVTLSTIALAGDMFQGKVVRVLDGDTIEVMRSGQAVGIRYTALIARRRGSPTVKRPSASRLTWWPENRLWSTSKQKTGMAAWSVRSCFRANGEY